MKRLERDVLLADRESVTRILSRLPEGDALGRSAFEARLKAIDEELAKIANRVETGGSVALMFGGTPVRGSRAIDAEFASKVLDTFHSLVSTKLAADWRGSLGSRGPVPAISEPMLAITELVRGSVGFLLEENSPNTQLAETPLKMAIDEVTEIVARSAAESEYEFERAIDTLEPRLVVSLRDFFRTLDDHGATLRIVEDTRDATLDATAVHRARSRIDTTEIEDSENDTVVGELLGLLPQARRFEMKLTVSNELIRGSVAATYAQQYLELIENQNLVGRTWRAKMRIREVRELNKPPRKLYTLIGLLEPLDKGKRLGAPRPKK